MTTACRPGSTLKILAAAAVLLLLVASLSGAVGLTGLRVLGLAAFVLTLAALWQWRDPRFLLAPMLPITATAVLLVLVLPGLLPAGLFGHGHRDFYARALTLEPVLAARMVAGFAGLALAVLLACASRWAGATRGWFRVRPIALPHQAIIVAVTLALAVIYGLGYRPGSIVSFDAFGSTIPQSVYEAMTPVLCLAVAFFAIQATVRPRSVLFFLLAAAALVLALAATLTIRNALMVLVACGVLLIGLPGQLNRRVIVAGLILAGIAGTMGTWGVYHFRYGTGGVKVSLYEILRVKVGERFTVTYLCLSGAAAHGTTAEAPQSPLYFVQGLVPRALWPEKPVLSRGDYYSETYCGIAVDPQKPGSMSITLVGEPLVEAGPAGLAAAAAAWVVLTLGFTRLCLSLSAPGAAWLAAMIPWFADFDQSFALYLAQGVKSALIMAPFVLVWWWWNERPSRA